jgi:hypothetical protein
VPYAGFIIRHPYNDSYVSSSLPTVDTIFTLNARDNVFLEVLQEHFRLSPEKMYGEIRALFNETLDALNISGINYLEIKTALVPSTNKYELALLFNSQEIDSYAYGREIFYHILPLLDRRTTQSALVGDLVAGDIDQEFIFELLRQHLVSARHFTFVHSRLIYCVYLNNLTEHSARNIIEGLKDFPAYIGCIPTTFDSIAKTFFSMTLCNLFVKRESIVIIAHEDDRPNIENVNNTFYPFEEFGYQVRSIQEQHFNLFLSFKIERAVLPGYESDTEFALNALSQYIEPLIDLQIVIEEPKLEYLMREKTGSLSKAGIMSLGADGLKNLIRRKLAANYIYNLRYVQEHNVMLFNIILEVERSEGGDPMKMLLSLEYKPTDKYLRVVTLY